MCGLLHDPLRALPKTVIVSGAVFIPGDTGTRRSTGTSTATYRTRITRSRTCTTPSARCRTVWMFGRTIPTHEESEVSNVVGEERMVDGVLARI